MASKTVCAALHKYSACNQRKKRILLCALCKKHIVFCYSQFKKVHTLDIAPLHCETPTQKRSGMARVLKGSQFYLHTFIHNRNEPYLPLPSQPQLVLIYRPQRDGRLSRPWCEAAPAEIRTRKLPIANPTLYHTATSGSNCNMKLLKQFTLSTNSWQP